MFFCSALGIDDVFIDCDMAHVMAQALFCKVVFGVLVGQEQFRKERKQRDFSEIVQRVGRGRNAYLDLRRRCNHFFNILNNNFFLANVFLQHFNNFLEFVFHVFHPIFTHLLDVI